MPSTHKSNRTNKNSHEVMSQNEMQEVRRKKSKRGRDKGETENNENDSADDLVALQSTVIAMRSGTPGFIRELMDTERKLVLQKLVSKRVSFSCNILCIFALTFSERR